MTSRLSKMTSISGLSQKEKDILQTNTDNIISNLSSTATIVCMKLYSKKILNQYKYDACNSKATGYEKIDYLLTVLRECGSRAFVEFCNAVEEVNTELAHSLLGQLSNDLVPRRRRRRSSSSDEELVIARRRRRGSSSSSDEEPDFGMPLNLDSEPVNGNFTVKTDNLIYDMTRKIHGYALIFNIEEFSPELKLSARTGSSQDASMLEELFRVLNYTVKVFRNSTKQQIEDIISRYSGEMHTEFDSFICAFLSHGDSDFIYGHDGEINLQDLFAKFKGRNCPSLAGKPKIFFIQACRGNTFDDGVAADTTDSQTSTLSESAREAAVPHSIGQKLPSESDFLLAYATVSGYFAYRSRRGSWFIQAVVDVLMKYHQHMDLMRMLTRVNFIVAQRESQHPDVRMRAKKQTPSIVSRLRKDVFFSIEAARKSGTYRDDTLTSNS